ncbi:Eburicol 14-alpha-demethylase [Metarhizium anisopliae]|nr:Eburicol 14-alpha-demethylase [Metarhizium anisopliae]
MEFRPFTEHLKRMAYASPILFLGSCLLLLVLLLIVVNLLRQQLPASKSEPPLVFHWIPFIGNAVSYGLDPFAFYSQCQKKHGNIFTFVLFGRKMTVYLGLPGNDFILNGKLQDVNAEEIYAPLTTPVFGSDIIYDCPNAKLMEQKKFVKFGLTHDALCSYVPLIEKEVVDYLKVAPAFRGQSGTVNIPAAMAEITIFTASRTLQGKEHSSSSSSSWIMLRLASRPDIVEELYQEQVRNLGYTGSGPLQYSDIDKLPLLQNVIKETLRVHSSIHSIMRKVMRPIPVPKTDYVIGPDKVLVSSPIMSHMSEEHFANAHVWDPHRWENMSTEEKGDMVDYGYGQVSKGTKSPYLPFGAGRHRCIGEKFAYMNLCTIIATLVRNMKFATVDGKSAVPPTDYTSLFSRPMQPSTIRWERRANVPSQA